MVALIRTKNMFLLYLFETNIPTITEDESNALPLPSENNSNVLWFSSVSILQDNQYL